MSNCPTPCPNCPRKYLPLPGDGPQPSRFLALLERPGFNENQQGRVAVGKAGQELDETYLPLTGLHRNDIRVSNVVQCWADNNRTPSVKEVWSCAAHHIPEELRETEPEVVILMGGSACSLCPGIRLDIHHGIPQHTSKVGDLFGWQGWVVPMFHPAIGLHEGRWMTLLLEDWARLREELEAPGDPESPPVDYRIARCVFDVDYYYKKYDIPSGPCQPNKPPDWTGTDTERHGSRDFSVQVSVKPGTGIMIHAEDRPALERLRFHMDQCVMHNALADIGPLERMGQRITVYRDTMQEAYQLGNLPQGLKPLVYRLFRQTMTSWEDTVRPASINALLSWLGEALVVSRLDLCSTAMRQYKTCVCGHGEPAHWNVSHAAKCPCTLYTPRSEAVEVRGSAEALFDRLIQHTDAGSGYDPWKRLRDWRAESEKEYAHVVARCGEWPILGIGNCTQAQAIQYAVGDADYTGRVAVELERRRGDRRFEIVPGDEDNVVYVGG